MLRWITAGESHGPALVGILEGLPAGVEITTDVVADALARRRLGYGRGARMAFEKDLVTFQGGVRHGLTMGGPIAVDVANSEWPKWTTVMSADPVDADELASQARNAPLTRPRPGHADLVGMQKYGFDDARPVLERASARETAARVAVGEFARQFLSQALGVTILSHVVGLGSVQAPDGVIPGPDQWDAVDQSPVRCIDPDTEQAMIAEKLNRLDEMEKLLRAVIEQDPEHHNAYNALGFSLADRKLRLPEAKALIIKALSFAPNDPFITDSLGWVEFRLDNLPSALQHLQKAYQARPDAEIAAHLGEVLWQLNRQDEARAIWREGIKVAPDNETLQETLQRLKAKL